jgi:hypothetical protein
MCDKKVTGLQFVLVRCKVRQKGDGFAVRIQCGARCDKRVTGLYFLFHKENQVEEMLIVTGEKIVLVVSYANEINFRNI